TFNVVHVQQAIVGRAMLTGCDPMQPRICSMHPCMVSCRGCDPRGSDGHREAASSHPRKLCISHGIVDLSCISTIIGISHASRHHLGHLACISGNTRDSSWHYC